MKSLTAELSPRGIRVNAVAPGNIRTSINEHLLADPDYETFLTPNADTLYSNAWLDLARGPVLLIPPPVWQDGGEAARATETSPHRRGSSPDFRRACPGDARPTVCGKQT